MTDRQDAPTPAAFFEPCLSPVVGPRPTSFDAYTICIYNWGVQLTWHETKRRTNLTSHGLDFVDAEEVFAGPTFTFEDDRLHYPEQRFVTLGLLRGVCVSLVHTEMPERIHVISFRKATRNEQIIFFQNV